MAHGNTVGIAVAQFAPTDDADGNVRRIAEFSRTAAERGASVVLAPEYASFFVNPMDERLAENAQPLDGPFTRALAELSRENSVTIVAGLVESAAGSRVRNTAVAVDHTGVVAAYRKQHLYDAFGQTESRWIEPGELGAPQTFDVAGLRFGLMTCYDLRFPELSRVIVDAGADVILVPAEWVRGPLKEHHWRTLVTARAIENTVYVAAADHSPPIGVGNSLIVDPSGTAVAGVGTEDALAIAWASRARLDETRTINPALALRRYRVEPRT
ncbi:carbon-nitrogen hydrolase family protein [Microbacterium amylolyticum]|uniref:Amidohydrolase n=1 Tax=Microbacterium amylolyticum TaxID=936337 RepID=A0ABS4ZLF6_9MICO|nr:carbon-nitrogen hydrolase family protein [Microbacterium amylolyticum]MBP2437790.1 putative amidohydrolase [Microbacterium amylolyticum]